MQEHGMPAHLITKNKKERRARRKKNLKFLCQHNAARVHITKRSLHTVQYTVQQLQSTGS